MSKLLHRKQGFSWALACGLALALSPMLAFAQHEHHHMEEAAAPSAAPVSQDHFGVLVMAHGGIAQWEKEVSETLAPLRQQYPMEIAFGMADAVSLQQGVAALEKQGVENIAVVRLFISGESWYDRTLQILGVQPGAPARPAPDPHAGHGEHAGHSMEFWKIDSKAHFAMSKDGLMDAPEIGEVLAARARALSKQPKQEDVLILAHGPDSDAENTRWLAEMNARADAVRKALPFRRVEVMTLREDWPEKREAATQAIRGYVQRANAEGGNALVIPFRVQGFGPYAKTLDGLTYVADDKGLVPHMEVMHWVQREADQLRAQLQKK